MGKTIRGKTLKEWKEYSEKDTIPIRAFKYITVLEETLEQVTLDLPTKKEWAKFLL